MRFASVDIGSNTTLLLVVEKTQEGFEVLSDDLFVTRLAEGLEKSQKLSKEALLRLDQAFDAISQTLQAFQVQRVSLVATSASRQAQNKEALFELGQKHNLPNIEVITPEREAELTFMGSLFGLGEECKHPLVIDIGGGSTEIVHSTKGYSIDIGSVTLTEKCLTSEPMTTLQKATLNQLIEKKLLILEEVFAEDFDKLIFTAGTPISLAFLEKQTQNPNDVHGMTLTESTVDFWLNELAKMSTQERKKIKYLPPHRSDVIVAGLSLLKQILHQSGKKEFVVSATGVRYGLLLEEISQIL